MNFGQLLLDSRVVANLVWVALVIFLAYKFKEPIAERIIKGVRRITFPTGLIIDYGALKEPQPKTQNLGRLQIAYWLGYSLMYGAASHFSNNPADAEFGFHMASENAKRLGLDDILSDIEQLRERVKEEAIYHDPVRREMEVQEFVRRFKRIYNAIMTSLGEIEQKQTEKS